MNPTSSSPLPDNNRGTNAVPEYDAELSSYHRAFGTELREAIRHLPFRPHAQVLDVPCGDGFYTRMLADAIAPTGHVTGADALAAYLHRGERNAAAADVLDQTDFVEGDAYHLPFDDASFDAVWCAQSFISLDAPLAALREFGRVMKPNGFLAVLESDDFHHVVLPWPADFEVALQAALQDACRERYGSPTKTYVSRSMRRWLREAGFDPVHRASYTADRQQPLDADTQTFLQVYLHELAEFIRPHMQPVEQQMLDLLTDPSSDQYLPAREDFELTCLFTIWRSERNV